jgi:hypothetical protein
MLERLLGLPNGLRVVENHEEYSIGLLGDEQAHLLLNAVSTTRTGGPGDYLLAVSSLRDGISRFKKYIDP